MEANAVKFSPDLVEQYDDVFKGIIGSFDGIKLEKHKVKGIQIVRRHVQQFHKQIIAPITSIAEREKVLARSSFMKILTN